MTRLHTGLLQLISISPPEIQMDSAFPFLQKLDDLRGREVDNADFLAFENPAAVPDDVFSAAMMKEFPGWISAARRVGILD